ncbi:MAG: SNF2 helicase associated domain-containing protein [Ruminococcus sp.]|nr:SNF2 helicase associated domain-containing protein [Ruminococcus sp.]
MSFNIKYYEQYFSDRSLSTARGFLKNHKVTKFVYTENGFITARVKDNNRNCTVSLILSDDGSVSEPRCTCPSYYIECSHIAAVVMLAAEKRAERLDRSDRSSDAVGMLINSYTETAVSDTPLLSEMTPVRILPEITLGRNVTYSLTIGRDRQYKVKDITAIHKRFAEESEYSYGKNFSFKHKIEALDEKSRRLLDLTVLIFASSNYYSRSIRDFTLDNKTADKFFEIYKDDYVSIDGKDYYVTFEDPKVCFSLTEASNSRFKIVNDGKYILLLKGIHGIFLDMSERRLYAASPAYTKAIFDLYDECAYSDGLLISQKDMPQFYTAVLKKVRQYAEVEGLDKVDEFVPPELIPQLYIDLNENSEVIGRLDFRYGDKIYPSMPKHGDPHNPYSDKAAEKIALMRVDEYFETIPRRWKNPLAITDEKKMIEFISEGLPKLTDVMEVYASDRFKRISNRPPIKPVVGVRPEGSLLLVNISDENYTNEELIEILGAYRRGAKYTRLKNGSFALINDSVAELDELTKNLNITDKQMLKENMNIPRYRMMYLDSLKRSENFRLQRSEDFKKAVRKYRSGLEGTEATEVPPSLDDIMRDYQRYGFRWLKTLSAYGFGGILADDMGLGKTLQAIALMLDAKNRSAEHIQSLVVCPATLTLNWENEINRFAPELKALTVIGTVTARDQLLENADDYDVMITSYTTLTRDIAKYENRKFYLHFIDEAQYIKNHGTQMAKAVKAVNSQVRFALTGTPVENSLAELWSIFDFVMPDYLFNYNRFKKNFETPIVSKKDEKAVKSLQKSVSPFILRRMKKEVLTELPDKTETILTSAMEPEQRKIYAANAEQLRQSLGSANDSPEERIKILAMLTRLRQLCCDPHLVYENYEGGSAKLEQCIDLVESCVNSGHKILLFSQFTSMLAIIRSRFDELGISWFELTGETKPKERIRMMNEFNTDSTQVFLISLKAGGTGLNLTGADIVIHYDPWWNVSAENQASDRVYRIGQRNNVQVYKLVADKSIEQNILKLQEAKKNLSDIAVNGEGDIMRMSAEEILSLL